MTVKEYAEHSYREPANVRVLARKGRLLGAKKIEAKDSMGRPTMIWDIPDYIFETKKNTACAHCGSHVFIRVEEE